MMTSSHEDDVIMHSLWLLWKQMPAWAQPASCGALGVVLMTL